MSSTLPIGDFSRATHLSVKMLRHYHEIGLLEPVEVDPDSGYRRYDTDQIVTAQVIRRFRELDMPLDEIHAVLDADDAELRNEVIAGHLTRLEASLARTQEAVASLRGLLNHPGDHGPIGLRRVDATSAALISEVVDRADVLVWFRGALGELGSSLAAQGIRPTGPAAGIYDTALFTEERGGATMFVPCTPPTRELGRVAPGAVPAVELATMVHPGPHQDIDRTYGALAAYVTEHALAVEGPIREYYVVGPLDTEDESAWRTEVGWPIFQTRPC